MRAESYHIIFSSIVLWVICFMSFATAANSDELVQGGWKLRVLFPGRSLSPSYTAWVDGNSINITKLNSSARDKFFSQAVGLLRMLNLKSHRQLDEAFQFKPSLSPSLLATKKGDSIDVYCNPGLMDGMDLSQLLKENGFLSKYFSDAMPIRMLYDGQCVALPWRLEHISVHYQYSSHKDHCFTFALVLRERETSKIRVVVVDATPFSHKPSKREGSIYGMLGAIIALGILRIFPRYFARRNGYIGRGGVYRNRGRLITASEKRKLVREKCEEIIREMKAEDGRS